MMKKITVTLPIDQVTEFPYNESEIEKLRKLLELEPELNQTSDRFKHFNDLNKATNSLIKTINEAYDFAAEELTKDPAKSTSRIEENYEVKKIIQDSLQKQSDLLN